MSVCADTTQASHCMDHQYIVTLAEMVKSTSEDVKLVKESLLGTLNEEGWLSKIRTLESEVEELKQLKNKVTFGTITSLLAIVGALAVFLMDKIKF